MGNTNGCCIKQDFDTLTDSDVPQKRLKTTMAALSCHDKENEEMCKTYGVDDSPLKYEPVHETHEIVATHDDDGHEHLNQYVILEEVLGEGTTGKVVMGFDTESHHFHAIKVYNRSFLKKSRRFGKPHLSVEEAPQVNTAATEIAIMKRLKHPNVTRLFEVLDDDHNDKLYLILEYVEKGSVMGDDVSKVEPLPIETCRSYFCDCVAGVEYLHLHGVAHRDLKPANMLLTKDGRLKLADFGVSQLFPEHAKERVEHGGSAGTPAFTAPEVINTEHGEYFAKRADIWAMGVTLYVFAFGCLPFNAENSYLMYECIDKEAVKIPCPPGTCPLLRDLLVKLLDKNPATRITIHEIRHHPWVTLDGKAPLAAGQDKVSVEVTDEERDSGVFTGVNKRGAIQRMASLKHLMHKKRVSLELRRKSSGAQSMLAIAAAASAARKASISPEMVLEGTTASVRAADEA